MCDLYGFIGGLSGTASITTLAAISLDRYTAVKYPLNMATSTNRVYLSVVRTQSVIYYFVCLFNFIGLFMGKRPSILIFASL